MYYTSFGVLINNTLSSTVYHLQVVFQSISLHSLEVLIEADPRQLNL